MSLSRCCRGDIDRGLRQQPRQGGLCDRFRRAQANAASGAGARHPRRPRPRYRRRVFRLNRPSVFPGRSRAADRRRGAPRCRRRSPAGDERSAGRTGAGRARPPRPSGRRRRNRAGADARKRDRRGAHRARFERDVEIALGKPRWRRAVRRPARNTSISACAVGS